MAAPANPMMSYGSISLPIGGPQRLRQIPCKSRSAAIWPRGIIGEDTRRGEGGAAAMPRGSHSGGLRSVLSIMAGLGVAAAGARPAEGAGVNIGTLTCSVASGWGLILGSARALGCNFTAYGGPAGRYVGTIWELGPALG